MLDYLEYLNVPTKVALALVVVFFCVQIIGGFLDMKGKVVPEYLNIKAYFVRKKKEREVLHQMPAALENVRQTLDSFNAHYSADNISRRDEWIEKVNKCLEANDNCIKELSKKLDKNNEDTLTLLIESKRSTIISFASKVIDRNSQVTKEQFNRIFRLYKEYEDIIAQNGLTNGEVDIAYRIITESYEEHMRDHTFVEDVLGYNV